MPETWPLARGAINNGRVPKAQMMVSNVGVTTHAPVKELWVYDMAYVSGEKEKSRQATNQKASGLQSVWKGPLEVTDDFGHKIVTDPASQKHFTTVLKMLVRDKAQSNGQSYDPTWREKLLVYMTC